MLRWFPKANVQQAMINPNQSNLRKGNQQKVRLNELPKTYL